MRVRPGTDFEALMISFIPVISTSLSMGSVNHGLVRMPTLPAELVRPIRPREVTPVELNAESDIISMNSRLGNSQVKSDGEDLA
jgi:hypothetical protein